MVKSMTYKINRQLKGACRGVAGVGPPTLKSVSLKMQQYLPRSGKGISVVSEALGMNFQKVGAKFLGFFTEKNGDEMFTSEVCVRLEKLPLFWGRVLYPFLLAFSWKFVWSW